MVMEGAEKQAGRLWDKFGVKELVKEKYDTLVIITRQWHVFVTGRKVCILWELEGDISVSEGKIPSEFETFCIVSVCYIWSV